MPLGCALLVLIHASLLCCIGACRMFYFVGVHLHILGCFLLVLIHASLLCSIGARKRLCFVGAHLHFLDVLCQCLFTPPCYALLVFVRGFVLLVFICTSLMCFVNVRMRLLAMFY